MIVEQKQQFSIVSFILNFVLLPVSVPFLIIKLFNFVKFRYFRECLPGKVVLITGASSGLGEALAHVFYMSGCKVILAARRKEELERVKKDLLEIHSVTKTHPPVVVSLDLSDFDSLPTKISQVLDIFGHIDILINNGGISVRSSALETSLEVDMRIMNVNYFGTIALTKAVLPSMIKRKEGRIVCVSSVQGKFAIPHRSAYAASKHALQAFCDTLRAEMDEHNVKVTCISPGYINTALSRNALTGSGTAYGVLDPSTASGTDPYKISHQILKSVLNDEKDVVLASLAPKLAYWLRFVSPSLYFWVMAKRAHKLTKKSS